jgi:hypothetical protein
MDMASISAAITSAKALTDILKAAASVAIDTKVLTRINDAQVQVSELLAALLDAQGELFKLQNETQDLRRQIQLQEDWEKRKAGYQLQQTAGGAVVYASVSTSLAHYACPRCLEKREIQILQSLGDSSTVRCPNCEKFYQINPPPPVKQPGRPKYNFGGF